MEREPVETGMRTSAGRDMGARSPSTTWGLRASNSGSAGRAPLRLSTRLRERRSRKDPDCAQRTPMGTARAALLNTMS
ncbi:hypothetical protein Cci01nite_63360 [Catellatospora citrea]|uniref:Uncharacterized protein n=1 Tax=Catellatospora citrea TaxID=53366 RepID=A0A8J3KJK6_9ACTN|nr:hypothetical protein Cci01nite_63360 [Catellatospora citrea]